MKNVIFAAIAVLGYLTSYGQVTQANNVPSGTNFVGFDNTSGVALPIRNDGFREIDISSNGSNKFAISELATWNGLNGLSKTNVQRTTMGLEGEQNLAWSMLHLRSDIPTALTPNMQRNWMNVGVSYTANQDFMYSGLLERPDATGNLKTDAVIAWGCQDAPSNPDNFRFIFLRPQTGSAPAQQVQGLETMRITPWGHVGIGDVFSNALQPARRLVVAQRTDSAQFRISWGVNPNPVLGQHADFQVSEFANLHVKPRDEGALRSMAVGFLQNELSQPFNNGNITTTLDVGGLTRIRELQDSVPLSLITGYHLDGAQQNNSDHFLGRLDFPGDTCSVLNGVGEWIDVCNLSGGDLDWQFNANHVWTGHGQNGFPGGKVGIGINGNSALGKLHVQTTATAQPANLVAIRVDAFASSPPTPLNTGIEIQASGGSSTTFGTMTRIENNSSITNFGHSVVINTPSTTNYGINTKVSGGMGSNYGGWLEATSSGGDFNYGAYGFACNAFINFGVFGRTCSTGNGNYAGYFLGDLAYTGSLIPPSDENLKTDIQDIESATDLLSQLEPKIYHFNQDIPQLNLPEGPQYGLIAQQVEEILPFLVQTVTRPSEIDSAGNVIMEAYTYKGLKYLDFIALLIAGFNEQQIMASEQGAMLTTQDSIIAGNVEIINSLQEKINVQQEQLEAVQSQMAAFATAVQSIQQKTNNCCQDKDGSNDEGFVPYQEGTLSPVELGQNIPNPFEFSTRIDFHLPSDAQVILEISDAQGRPIRKLIDGNMSAGAHSTTFDGSGLAKGVYYYTLYADGQLLTKRMMKL